MVTEISTLNQGHISLSYPQMSGMLDTKIWDTIIFQNIGSANAPAYIKVNYWNFPRRDELY